MNRIAPAWLRPIGRVFPRVVIEHAHAAHAPVHATHVASELGVSVVSMERAVAFGITERRAAVEAVEAAEPERREEERIDAAEPERIDAAEPERHQEDRRNEVAEERSDGERSHAEPERHQEDRRNEGAEDRRNEGADDRRNEGKENAEAMEAAEPERREEERREEERREEERRDEDRRNEGADDRSEAVEAAEDRRKEGAESDEKQRKDYGDSEEDTFGILSVRSLSDVSDMSGVADDFEHDANELSCFTTLGPLGPVDCPLGPVEGAAFGALSGALSGALGAVEKTGPTYEDQVRFIAQADAETMQRRHVTGEGVYYFPRFSSATEERRAQKAPRRACIELGETVFSFGTVMYDGEIELTFLGHRVARTRRGDFNARVERRGNALVVVAVDQILVFREIIVDATWMETMAL